MKRSLLAASLALLAGAAPAQQVNVICSVQAEWCNMIQTVFAKTTGVKINLSLKGSGEALAQLIAERAKEKGVTKVVFDRGGYLYHGRVKALVDAAREAGLEF